MQGDWQLKKEQNKIKGAHTLSISDTGKSVFLSNYTKIALISSGDGKGGFSITSVSKYKQNLQPEVNRVSF